MDKKYILIAVVIAIVITIFTILILIVKKSKKTVVVKKTKPKQAESIVENKYTIKDMVKIAAKRNTTRDELKKAIDIVKKDFIFPKKIKNKTPKDIKVYLNFVLLVASHKNSDAKLIAYMELELKKANPEYITEIDIYENEGFAERKNRI